MAGKVNAKWIASLSDGATFIEGVGNWWGDTTQHSPWFKLQKYLKKNNLHITGMRIQVWKPGEPTKTYNLPSMRLTDSGQHDKFCLRYPITPISYNYYRWSSSGGVDDTEFDPYIEVQAVFEDFILSIIVCERTGNESWSIVHKRKKD